LHCIAASLFLPLVRGAGNPPSARTRAVIRHATARCESCEPTGADCEPRINKLGSGADHLGREHPAELMNVSREGCSMASPAFNECEPLHLNLRYAGAGLIEAVALKSARSRPAWHNTHRVFRRTPRRCAAHRRACSRYSPSPEGCVSEISLNASHAVGQDAAIAAPTPDC
jgi:hypothetical protein